MISGLFFFTEIESRIKIARKTTNSSGFFVFFQVFKKCDKWIDNFKMKNTSTGWLKVFIFYSLDWRSQKILPSKKILYWFSLFAHLEALILNKHEKKAKNICRYKENSHLKWESVKIKQKIIFCGHTGRTIVLVIFGKHSFRKSYTISGIQLLHVLISIVTCNRKSSSYKPDAHKVTNTDEFRL